MFNIKIGVDKPDVVEMEKEERNMMQRGIRIADCNSMLSYYTSIRDDIKLELQNKYNIENPNSPAQVIDFIEYMSRHIDLSSKNDIINICFDDKKQKWTSNDQALSKLALLGYEFAQDIRDYRRVKKYVESITSMQKLADQNMLVHPNVSRSITNRIYYSDPAIMSIPKDLLYNVITPYNNGDVLYSADIKNQEPSILINMTNANDLKEALTSPDGLYEFMFKKCFTPNTTANIIVDTLDENRVYTIPELRQNPLIAPALYLPKRPMTGGVYYKDKRVTGIENICVGSRKGVKPSLPAEVSIEVEDGTIYNVPVEWEDYGKKYTKSNDYSVEGTLNDLEVRVLPVEREEFKTAWLAISYGQSLMGLMGNCKVIDGKYVYNFITKSNGLKEYRSAITKKANNLDHCINTIFGTRLEAEYTTDSKKLSRQLLNLPIQGSGADILSLLIRHFNEYVTEKGLKDKMFIYFTRHDELVIEVNGDYVNKVGDEKVKEILSDILTHQIEDWTPFRVDIEQINKNVDKSKIDESYDF
jgi:hypothetical protein